MGSGVTPTAAAVAGAGCSRSEQRPSAPACCTPSAPRAFLYPDFQGPLGAVCFQLLPSQSALCFLPQCSRQRPPPIPDHPPSITLVCCPGDSGLIRPEGRVLFKRIRKTYANEREEINPTKIQGLVAWARFPGVQGSGACHRIPPRCETSGCTLCHQPQEEWRFSLSTGGNTGHGRVCPSNLFPE